MDKKYVSVYALNRYLKAKVDRDVQLQNVLIKGEISNYRPHPSGHMYFTLKDEKAAIKAIMFVGNASKLTFKAENGMKVLIEGHVSVYEKTGDMQLYCTKMDQDGIGNLYYQFEQLKLKLEKEGYFDQSHKKPIPSFPMRIAILSARQGAALQDTLRTLKKRFPVARVVIFPVPVQGKDAYKKIIETLHLVDQLKFSIILLVRGGGSIEELWNFNEEELVKCIYHLKTPIITGVGHETDFTLVDFVSDLRAITPTGAAIDATPDIQLLLKQVQTSQDKLNSLMFNRINIEKERLKRMSQSYVFKNPSHLYENEYIRLTSIKDRLYHYGEKFVESHLNDVSKKLDKIDHLMMMKLELEKNTYKARVEKLDLVSPLKILSKGYSIVYKDETIIKSVNDLHSGDEVHIKFKDGDHTAVIK